MAKEVAKLHEERKLMEVAYNKPSPWIASTSTEGIKVFESRRLITNDVMKALKDDRFHMIAICGVGGVGKTTMVKEVAKRAKEEKLFDEVVMAVVSQIPDKRKIQGEIGDELGLKFDETERGRADRLCKRLNGTKRILVILDNVWKRLELNDIGIPFGDGYRGCKILLTSRFDNVCNDMNAQKKFTVEVLTKEEAWSLFEEMAGISNDTSHTSTDLYITQKKVADECGCVPIAIVTVARALKDTNRHSWNSALLQLRKSMVKNIRVEEKVFKSLELSYNFLPSREIKECFLLCSLYAEDFNIPIEDIVRYGVGIELFERIDSVKEARDRVHAVVDSLKKGYLLMDGEREDCVKMHCVVRDVAISIASREEHSFMVRCDEDLKEWPEKERHKNYAVISLRCTGMSKLPDNLEFPKLHLLRLEDSYVSKLPDSFYRGMKELKALSMLNVYIEESLPTSLRWLTNLRSLSLYECRLINDISVIGALENLEILSFQGTEIEELPKEIGRLSHLKLLDLFRCGVTRICPGVLSSLSKLEELYLGNSFDDENRIEETKATLTELCGLSNFTTLVIHLQHFAYWPRDLVLTNLKSFAITISFGRETRYFFDYQLQNQFSLNDFHESDLMESGFKNLFKITKILEITRAVGVRNVGYDLDKGGFKKLTELFLEDCQDLEYVIETTYGVPVPRIAFPMLQSLRLDNLDKLKEICHGQLPKEAFSALKRLELRDLPALTHLWKGPTQLVRLRNLTSLELTRCHKLESMFSLSIAKDLMQLQKLDVSQCRKMEVLISSEEEGDQSEIASTTVETTDKIVFPKLKILYLRDLPSFTAICKAMNGIENTIQPLFNKVAFSGLKWLELWNLPAVTHLWKGPTQLVWLRNLTFLNLKGCNKLESMFSLSIARDLIQLQELDVSECRKLEVLISSEEEGDQNEIASTTTETTEKIVFPKLKELYLRELPSFTAICKAMNGIELLQLNTPILSGIPKRNSFCNTSDSNYDTIQPLFNKVIFPALEELRIDRLPKITEIWYRKLLPSESFRQLRYMTIRNCQELKVIVLENGEEEVKVENNNNTISFPQLRSLTLEHLQSLESFCTSRFETQSLFTSQVIFRALEELRIDRLPKITEIWYRKLLPSESFRQLRYMTIRNCEELKVMVLENGEEGVKVENNNNAISFPRLTRLTLEHLQSLESFCTSRSDFTSQVIFPALEELRIDRLPKITEILYWKSLPSDSFRQLRYMTIRNCQELKVVVLENGEEGVKVENNNNTISFPQLTSLTLEHLQSLESFCTSRSETQCLFTRQVAFPALEELLISGVPNITEIWGKQFPSELKVNSFEKLMNAIRSSMLPMRQNLRKLSENAKEKAMAQEKKRNDDVIVFPLLRTVRLDNLQNLETFCRARLSETQTLFNHQIACPELRVLAIGWVPNITDVWDKKLFPRGSFCQLREVRIEGCDKLVNVILSNMLPRLQNLTELSVQYCPMVEEILSEKGEEKADAEAKENILFPQLKTLELGSLENLKSFCTSRLAAQYFFKHPVAFASLKELHICNLPNITEIWGKQLLPVPKTDAQSFEKLAVVNATWCEKLVNVIPSSMFPRLQNLKSIYVKGCPEMEVIVSKKANATENGDIILFAQLSSLSIDKLYNLKSFCSSSTSSEAQPLFNDQVVFPVLEDLFINGVQNITKIWDKLHSGESFRFLKRMMIEDCEKLVNVVPSYMLPQLQNLEVLNVYSCLKMLAIVLEEEGKEKDDENTILFPKLSTLNLKSLDNLKTFYTQPFLNYQVALPKLKNPCLDQYLQQQLLKGKEFEIMNENDDKETEQDKRRRLKGKEFCNYE